MLALISVPLFNLDAPTRRLSNPKGDAEAIEELMQQYGIADKSDQDQIALTIATRAEMAKVNSLPPHLLDFVQQVARHHTKH